MQTKSKPSLKEYTTIATKIIAKVASKYSSKLANFMLKDDEAIGSVVNALITADEQYNDNYICKNGMRGVSNLKSFRTQRVKYKIFEYIKNYSKKNKTSSLDFPLAHSGYTGEPYYLKDVLVDEKQDEPIDILEYRESFNLNKEIVDNILNSDYLSSREKHVIKLRYFDDYTLEKIVDTLTPLSGNKTRRLTKQYISFILIKALRKIKENINVDTERFSNR